MLETERELIVEYGQKLITSGLTKGTGGNLSIFDRKKKLMAISPSGMDYFDTKPEDVVVMDLEGNIVEGSRKPSSEHNMHKMFYKNRQDIDAIVHTHSIFSATLSTLRWRLPASNYLVALAGLDVRCAEYASFGTVELANNALKAMEDRYAVLLANHGLLTGGKNIEDAFAKAEQIEYCAEVYCRAKSIGEPVILSKDEMKRMIKKFKTYGQTEE